MADKWIQLQSTDGIDNLYPTSKIDLLWENASPNASFAAQTISLDLSLYKIVYVLLRRIQNEVVYFMDSCIVGSLDEATNERVINSNTTGGNIILSRWWRATQTGVYFADASRGGTTSNTDFIPYRIYGVK